MNRASDKTRVVKQQEQIGRRESIIDARRDTRAPAFQPQQDLRSARRGDVGGADALLRTLGLVENAGSEIQKYMTNKNALDEQDNIAKGAADQARGAVDEEMMDKSLGYRNAVTKGRTITNLAEARRGFDEQLKRTIDDQTSTSLEDRIDEVNSMTEEFFANFATDPETGQFRDYLQSPGAMRYLAEEIQRTRPALKAAAQEMIETKFNAEALSHFNTNVTEQVLSTGTLDLAAARSVLPPTITDAEFADQVMISVSNAAQALRDRGTTQDIALAAGLMAGLKQRSKAPIATGIKTVSDIGAPQAPSGAGAASVPENAEQALRMPVQGTVTSAYGAGRKRGPHNGVDIAVPVGTPVPAAMGGEVIRAWTADDGGVSLKVKYDDGTVAGFAHLSEQAIKEGRFEAGTILAKTGNTGRSTGPHLHYTLTRDGKKIDPLQATLGTISAPPQAPAAEGAPAAPGLRLQGPFADPVSRLEQSGEFVDIVGIEDVLFTPEQTARIGQMYDTTVGELRREYMVREREEQGHNAAAFSMRLLGQGDPLSDGEIRQAVADRTVSIEDANALFRLRRSEQDRRESIVDGEEARMDRATERRRRDQLEDAIAAIITPALTGDMSIGEMRSAAVRAAAANPDIGPEILSGTLSVANSLTGAVQGSEEAQDYMMTTDVDLRDQWEAALKLRLPGNRGRVAIEQANALIDQSMVYYSRLLASGKNHAEAKAATEQRFGPRLNSLLPK